MRDQEVIDLGWDSYINGLQDSSVDIGILTKDGNEKVSNEFTLARLAAVQEYGVVINVTKKMRKYLSWKGLPLKNSTTTITIPSRPFMRQTFDEQVSELGVFIDKMELGVIEGKFDRNLALEIIGDFHKSEIQKNMTTKGKFKANHPFTIKQKGSSNELIDTGRLVNSMDIKVNGV
jgi:hypothetical protein